MTPGGQQGTAEKEMHNSTNTHYSDMGGTIGGTPSPRHQTVTADITMLKREYTWFEFMLLGKQPNDNE
jgi:hypothetical protein